MDEKGYRKPFKSTTILENLIPLSFLTKNCLNDCFQISVKKEPHAVFNLIVFSQDLVIPHV